MYWVYSAHTMLTHIFGMKTEVSNLFVMAKYNYLDLNGGLPPLYRRLSPVPGAPGRPPPTTSGNSPTARQQHILVNNSLEVQQQVE